MRGGGRWLGAALMAVAWAGCGDEPATGGAGNDDGPGGDPHHPGGDPHGPPASCAGRFPALALERVAPATRFALPTFVGAAAGDARRLYVVEQAGTIRVIVDGVARPTPFLDLTAITRADQENGLFAIAFDPDYARTGRFWISRTPALATVVVVEEYRRSAGDPERADPTPVRVLARSAPGDGGSHNAGILAFGPDRRLYWSVGDGRGGDAQDPAFLRGKLFRLDVDAPGAGPVDLAAAIWDRGLRNPWRFSFDRATGDLWIADVGAGTEELEHEPAGTGGRDYGWPSIDGTTCAVGGCDLARTTPPLVRAGAAVVVGGYVYRGPAIPCLRGWYLYTDYGGGVFSRLRLAAGTVIDHAEIAGLAPHPLVDQPATMGEDAAGELYVADHDGGELYRIVAGR